MTYYEAALEILGNASRALTAREIVEVALNRGLITPKGKTPVATMSAELYRRAGSDVRLRKVAEPGATRARRGSVRWLLKA
jgi:hypothetical protein